MTVGDMAEKVCIQLPPSQQFADLAKTGTSSPSSSLKETSLSPGKAGLLPEEALPAATGQDRPDMDVINGRLVNPVLQRVRGGGRSKTLGESGWRPSLSSWTSCPRDAKPRGRRGAFAHIQRAQDLAERRITPDAIVQANEFLIWQPSSQQITDAYLEMGSSASGIRIDEQQASATDVMALFVQRFGRIDPECWTAENIEGRPGRYGSQGTALRGRRGQQGRWGLPLSPLGPASIALRPTDGSAYAAAGQGRKH